MVKRNAGSMLSYNVTTCPLGHRSGRAVRFPSCTLACGAGEEGVSLPSPKPTTATVDAHGQSRSAFATGHRAHGSLFPGKRTLLVFDELFSQHRRRRHVVPGVEIQYSPHSHWRAVEVARDSLTPRRATIWGVRDHQTDTTFLTLDPRQQRRFRSDTKISFFTLGGPSAQSPSFTWGGHVHQTGLT